MESSAALSTSQFGCYDNEAYRALGQQFQNARQKLGVTVKDAAQALHLMVPQLRAIESGAFAEAISSKKIPAETFEQSVADYAELLEIDINQLKLKEATSTASNSEISNSEHSQPKVVAYSQPEIPSTPAKKAQFFRPMRLNWWHGLVLGGAYFSVLMMNFSDTAIDAGNSIVVPVAHIEPEQSVTEKNELDLDNQVLAELVDSSEPTSQLFKVTEQSEAVSLQVLADEPSAMLIADQAENITEESITGEHFADKGFAEKDEEVAESVLVSAVIPPEPVTVIVSEVGSQSKDAEELKGTEEVVVTDIKVRPLDSTAVKIDQGKVNAFLQGLESLAANK